MIGYNGMEWEAPHFHTNPKWWKWSLIIQDEGVPCGSLASNYPLWSSGFAMDLLWIGCDRSCLEYPSGSHPSLRNCCSWVSAAQDFDGVGCNYGILCYYGCTWHKQVTPAPPIEMIIFTNFHMFSLLGHPFFGSRSQLLQVCDPGHAGIFCAECPAGTYNPPGCPCPTREVEKGWERSVKGNGVQLILLIQWWMIRVSVPSCNVTVCYDTNDFIQIVRTVNYERQPTG